MARTYKQPSIVSGLTIEDILKMDEKIFESLSTSDLRKITGRLVSAGNKRLRTIERSGYTTPAYRSVIESGGKFSVSGKDKTSLRNEFQRAREFFNRKTSSVTKYKQVKKEIRTELSKKGGVDISSEDFDRVLSAFDKLKQNSRLMNDRQFRYRVLKIIKDIAKDNPTMTANEIKEKVFGELNEIYEEHKRIENESDTSSFFEL